MEDTEFNDLMDLIGKYLTDFSIPLEDRKASAMSITCLSIDLTCKTIDEAIAVFEICKQALIEKKTLQG